MWETQPPHGVLGVVRCFETRNPKLDANTKLEIRMIRTVMIVWDFEPSEFELVSGFEFRDSDFKSLG